MINGGKGVHYIGDYKPVKVMRNNIMLAGYEESEKVGETLEWQDTYNDSIRSVLVEGKSEQTVTVQGKNLFDKKNNTSLEAGYWAITDGTTPEETAIHYRLKGFLTVIAGQKYTISINAPYKITYVYFYNSSKIFLSSLGANAASLFTFMPPVNTAYIRFVGRKSDSAELSASDWASIYSSLQLELGSTATAYAPFVPNSPSPDYPSTIRSAGSCNLLSRNADASLSSSIALPALRSLPNGVKDTLENLGGGWWRWTQNIGVNVFDGTESSTRTTVGVNYVFSSVIAAGKAGYYQDLYCTHYKLCKTWPTTIAYANNIMTNSAATFQVGFIGPSDIDTIDEMRAFLAAQHAAGTPVTVQYQLATPIITDLNLGQLRTLPRLTRLEQDGAIKATITARARVAV